MQLEAKFAQTSTLLKRMVDYFKLREMKGSQEPLFMMPALLNRLLLSLVDLDHIKMCEDILHILPRLEQCSRRTTHSGWIMHHCTLPPGCLYPKPNVRCCQHVHRHLQTAAVRGYVTRFATPTATYM